jgi:NH3-dependent NAD+ synthetase
MQNMRSFPTHAPGSPPLLLSLTARVDVLCARTCSAKFNEYMSKCGLTAAAINLSGGVDSAVSYAIMKHAASLPGSPIKRIVAVGQPIHR